MRWPLALITSAALLATACRAERRAARRSHISATASAQQPSADADALQRLPAATAPPAATATATATSVPPPPSTKLTLSLDGEPFPIAGALVTTSGGRGFTLHVGTLPLDCKDVLSNGYAPRPGERRLTLDLGFVPQRGGPRWHVVSVVEGSFNHEGNLGIAEIDAGDTSAGSVVRARLRVKSEPRVFAGLDRGPIVIGEGAIEAKSCGAKRIHDAVPRPQPARMVIGGVDIPIGGAIVDRSDDGDVLWIQNAPIDCDSNVPFGDAAIRLFLDGAGNVAQVGFMGDSFLAQRSVGGLQLRKDRAASVTFSPDSAGAEVAADVRLALDLDGVLVSVEGKVTAVDCRKPQ